jgi:hypothetical protein
MSSILNGGGRGRLSWPRTTEPARWVIARTRSLPRGSWRSGRVAERCRIGLDHIVL